MNKAVCCTFLLLCSVCAFALGQTEKSNVANAGFLENVEAKRLEVQIGLSEPGEITEVQAQAAGQKFPVEYAPFGSKEDDTAAILFLIDKSDPKRARTIESVKALVVRLAEKADPRTKCAVYAFDANLSPVSEAGTSPKEVAAKLKPVKAAGMATEMYRSLLEAVAILEKMPVKRRAVWLFSDGKAEDTTYTLEQAVVAANLARVNISGVGYAESPSSSIYLQSMRRLASETGGAFIEAKMPARTTPPNFEKSVYARLGSGGSASIDLSENAIAKQIELTIQSKGHEPTRTSFTLLALAPPPPNEGKVAEVASQVEAMSQQMKEAEKKAEEARQADAAQRADDAKRAEEMRQAEQAKRAEEARVAAAREQVRAQKEKRQHLILAVAGLLALALLAGYFFLRRRRQAAAAALLENTPVFARLQVLDGDGTEHKMRTTALRIGRGGDNDLSLRNDSVSRHHAEIHRTREGAFTITELNSGNGVLVNGKTAEKATLQNEDVIELGEVRIRFLIGG